MKTTHEHEVPQIAVNLKRNERVPLSATRGIPEKKMHAGFEPTARKHDFARLHLRSWLCLIAMSSQISWLFAAPVTSPRRIFPPETIINITQPPYGAVPNDGKDDSSALQRAISEHVDSGASLFFPDGIYEIDSPLVCTNAAGVWRPHITFQGESRNGTILKLRDQAQGFTNPENPLAVITTGSFYEPGDNVNGGGNKAFRNNVFDMTIDTGSGNPGAIGIDWAVSNIGAIENVTVLDSGRSAYCGISIARLIPGPGLIRNVLVEGFETGVRIEDIQYGITAIDLQVRDQRREGVRIGQNMLHALRFQSENSVPAVKVSRLEGMVTLVDSTLASQTNSGSAIDCDGSLILRNVNITGYATRPVRAYGNDLEIGGTVALFFRSPSEPRGRVLTLPPEQLLTVENTPPYSTPPLDRTVVVGARREGETDDTQAIQRALDSGKETIYFKAGRLYHLSDTLVVRGKVKQVVGMGAEINLGAAKEPFSDIKAPRPLIRIDETESDTVFFENLFFNAQYPGEVIFENNTPKTVVIRHCAGWVGADGFKHSYRNTKKGTGKLFVEDVFLPGWEFNQQDVFAAQFNPENWEGSGQESQVINNGGRLLILGFKTEGPAPFIETKNGGITEVYGGYNYISAIKLDPVPQEAIPYICVDSVQRLGVLTENFRKTDYPLYLRTITEGVTTDVGSEQMKDRNGNPGVGSFCIMTF